MIYFDLGLTLGLDAASDLTTHLALGHVTHRAVVSPSIIQLHVTVVSRHVLLNRVLERLSLLLNAHLHLGSQLLVDPEVLHLKFHVTLFLRID